MDKLTPEQRHRCMAAIRSRDTKPELMVRRYLHACGLRFRTNVRKLPGTPDIVLCKYHTIIRIQGCFWHGHECQQGRLPQTNRDFWAEKIKRNRERDEKNRLALTALGWNVITLWECQLRPALREGTLRSLVHTLNHIYLLTAGMRENADKPLPTSDESLPYPEHNTSEPLTNSSPTSASPVLSLAAEPQTVYGET